MSGSVQASARARAFVDWTLRHGRTIWLVAALLAIPAVVRTVQLYAHLRSEIEELLPRDAPSVRALDELRRRSPGMQFLGVVARVDDVKNLPAAERFVDELGARLRTYPPDLVREVRADDAAERSFLEKHAALYVELPDLQKLRQRIEDRRDYEVAKSGGALLDDSEPPPSVDMSDLEKKYQARAGEDDKKDAHFVSDKERAAILIVEAGGFDTGAARARVLLDRVKADVKALSPATYAPGLHVGFASDIAINVEELDALEEDLSISSVLVVVAVVAVILLYYRWWRAVIALCVPLLLATVYAFALSSLPPMRVEALNSNTAFLGSIIVGNGINVGLILLARYREERIRGGSVEEALAVGVWGARAGTLAAAAAASAAYGSLVVTEFRGFRQFGYIGGLGMLASWATSFVLMPPLLRWLDDGKPVSARHGVWHGRIMSGVLALLRVGAPAILVVVAALAAISMRNVARFDRSALEYDFNKLRRADTWKNGAGLWSNVMDAALGHYLTPTVILCDTREQARAIEARVREAVDHGPLAGMVKQVVGERDVLPDGQAAKIEEAEAIRKDLTPKIRSLMTKEQLDRLDRMLGDDSTKPVAAADLPRGLVGGLRERDGTIGRSVLIYPAASDQLWHAEGIRTFVRTLRELAARDLGPGERPARIAGSIPLSGDILSSIERDAPIASAVSFLGVVAVVVIVVGRRRATLLVLGSLLLGVLWLGGATMALGVKINFANFIALPITFGIGVDYAVNVVTRYVQDGAHDISGAVRSTGGAVALCSLTTIIGYSSLLLAKNQALFLFGVLAVLGEIACLTAAVIALPAWMLAMRRWRHRAEA